jgi:hypothetical protein
MGCILRLTGSNLAVDDLLRLCTLEAYRVDRKGQAGPLKSSPPRAQPGIHLSVSDRSLDDLPGQIAEAISYLEINEGAIRRLREFPGVERAGLDFGIAWRDVAAQFDHFPSRLLQLAGNLGLDLELSHYPTAEPSASEAAGA